MLGTACRSFLKTRTAGKFLRTPNHNLRATTSILNYNVALITTKRNTSWYNIKPTSSEEAVAPTVQQEGSTVIDSSQEIVEIYSKHMEQTKQEEEEAKKQKKRGKKAAKDTAPAVEVKPEVRLDEMTPFQKQEHFERCAIDEAVERYKKGLNSARARTQGASMASSRQLLLEWFEPLSNHIYNYIMENSGEKPAREYLELMKLSPEKMAVIVMHEVLGLLLHKQGQAPISTITSRVADSIHAEINLQKLRCVSDVWRRVTKETKASTRKINSLARRVFEEDEDENSWPTDLKHKVGGVLVSCLLEQAKVMVDVEKDKEPAFQQIVVAPTKSRAPRTLIKLHPKVLADIDAAEEARADINPRHKPMIVEPVPWTGPREGGYIHNKAVILRNKDGSRLQRAILRTSTELSQVYAGLNTLNTTKWRVNKSLYEVIMKVWSDGGGLAAIPQRKDVPIPVLDVSQDELLENPSLRKQYYFQVRRAKHTNKDLHSLRCDTTLKLQVAKEFVDESFFFPHNMDFRGRAYPLPPHLNHLGSDFSRGLLVFDKKVKLTDRGFFWMKVHLGNLCGKDKMSLDDRVEFVDNNMDNILDSANNPLEGRRWWLKADDPWQCLAACLEFKNVLDWAKENNKPIGEYMSNYPIQMDGSCNGLQHYAALGRDRRGAEHVNLLPSPQPKDVYNGVKDVVMEYIEQDAKEGNPIAQLLLGNVERSTIKQTVMTSVYGVTFIGARQQIHKRLREKKQVPEDKVYACSVYLARVVMQSLGDVFSGAKNIMAWLNQCAGIIATTGMPVVWVTPLGLPVVQPYRSGSHRVKTVLQTVQLASENDKLPVSKNKQKTAFPPNYVHSLDASHMLMTATSCQKHGIDFASVHDSFWTHAATVDGMNSIIREEFINLHSQPLLEQLYDSFCTRYNVEFPPVPPRGDLDLTKVREALYFFD